MRCQVHDILRIVFGWAPEAKLSETAWINGARGLAAFNVMMGHYSMAWMSPFADAPFGAVVLGDRNPDGVWYFRQDERLWAPWRLPILRVFFCNGGGQVAIFFVISGFALTWSPLGAIQAGRYEKVYQSLGSSTIRRWIRLYVPCLIVSVAYLIHGITKNYSGIMSVLDQVWTYIVRAQSWANPFEPVSDTTISPMLVYNLVIWTIPHEFSGSIYVYVLLLGLGRVRSFARRISATLLITLYAFFSLHWSLWLFGCGMALADYCRHTGALKESSEPSSKRITVLWSLCMTLGLFLLSYVPQTSGWFSTPIFEWFSYVPLPIGWRDTVHEERFWWGLGGIMVIASSCHLRLVRRFFELPLLQHLGKISFMLYLIHFLFNHTLAMTLWGAFYAAFCKKEFDEHWDEEVYRTNPIINVAIYLCLWLIMVPLVMIAAHVLERTIDKPVTAFAKLFDEKLVNGFAREMNVPVDEEQEQLLEPRHDEGVELEEIPRS